MLKDSNGIEKFNTDNYYLKTDPNGTLKAGGYLKAPMVYGQGGTVGNHDNGWYTSAIIDWAVNPTAGPNELDIFVPRYTQLKLYQTPTTYSYAQYPAPAQAFYFNGIMCGTFRYVGHVCSLYGPDGEGSYTTEPYIDIAIDSIYGVGPPGPSGYFNFPLPTTNILTWSRNLPDGYGGYYAQTFASNYRAYGKSGWYNYKTPKFRPFAIMTTADPVNLSIAVTP